MAFRGFSRGAKVLLGVAGVGGAALFVGPIFTPYAREMYREMFNVRQADKDVVARIEASWKKLQATESNSLLKKHFTESILNKLKKRRTYLGATLLDCVGSGVANPDSSCGIYAADPECYTLFADLFDPIIEEYHKGFDKSQSQPAKDFGADKLAYFSNLDPKGKYIQSTRIRCGRTVHQYPFNPLMFEDNYLALERSIKDALSTMPGPELEGTYYGLDGMSKQVQKQLIDDHFLFKEGDRFLQAANACRYWPKGRGIFHNKEKTFLVWINEEDHMRIISMQKGGDVGAVLGRLIRAMNAIEKKLEFARNDRLGYLTMCPTNLGTTVRASVHIKLPKVSARADFKKICDEMKLQVRGIHGEHSESKGGIYDVSNVQRLGLTEYEAVKQMYDGVKKLIEMEEGK